MFVSKIVIFRNFHIIFYKAKVIMFAILVIALSSKVQGVSNTKEESTISVKTFYDYTVDLQNKGDVVNIEVPQNTFILISSIDGYTAVVEKPESESININSDPQKRLIYFKEAGTLKITSTISGHEFTFHSLPLDIFDGYTFTEGYLIVSTDPMEKFKFVSHDLPNGNSYNSSFSRYSNKNVLFWFISNKETQGYVSASTSISGISQNIVYVATASKNENDENKIALTEIIKNYQQASKSKFFVVKTDTRISGTIDISQGTINQENTNIFTNFRLVTQIDSLTSNCIVEKRKHCIEGNKITTFPSGIFDIDFSISDYFFEPNRKSIFIFPTKSNFIVDSNKDIFGFVNGGTISDSRVVLTKAEQITNEEIYFKVIQIDYPVDSRATRYIISTSPKEKIIINDENDNNKNYTNDQFYIYIMASLQDVETSVTYSGDVSFYLLRYQNEPELSQTESGSKIRGPFIAKIPETATCSFLTSPVGELKEGFDNDNRVIFKAGLVNILLSKRYGSFDTYDATNQKNSLINLNFLDACQIKTFNLVYIHEQSGWWGEIISPEMPNNDNKIGPEYQRTKFYTYDKDRNALYNEIMIYKSKQFDNVIISLTTHFTQSYPYFDKEFYCNKYLVINKVPSLHIISSDEGELQLTGSQSLCILPVFYPVKFGRYISNDGNDANVDVISYNGNDIKHTDTFYDDSLSEVVTQYKNYGNTFALIKVTKRKAKMDVIAGFIKGDDDGIPDDEPDFFSLFIPNNAHGIHKIENKNDNPGDGGDEGDEGDGDEEREIEDNADKINGYNNIDMTKKSLTIKCSKSTILFIHHIGNCIAEAFSSNGELFATIKKDSKNRIINFGGSDGVVKIKKLDSADIKLLDEKDFTISYSYLSKEKIKNITPYNIRCNDIFISSNPKSYIRIGDPENKGNNNFSLPLTNDFCLWFTWPVEMNSFLNRGLPHHHYLYINDGEEKEITESTASNHGYNLLYILGGMSLVGKNFYDEFTTSSWNNIDVDQSSFEYDCVDKLYTPSTNNCVFDSDSDEPTKPLKDNDKPPIVIIVAVVVIVVVIVIIIVVVVVCVKKKKNKKFDKSSDENDP